MNGMENFRGKTLAVEKQIVINVSRDMDTGEPCVTVEYVGMFAHYEIVGLLEYEKRRILSDDGFGSG